MNNQNKFIESELSALLEFSISDDFIGYKETCDGYILVCSDKLWKSSSFQAKASDFLILFENQFPDDEIVLLPESDVFALKKNQLKLFHVSQQNNINKIILSEEFASFADNKVNLFKQYSCFFSKIKTAKKLKANSGVSMLCTNAGCLV